MPAPTTDELADLVVVHEALEADLGLLRRERVQRRRGRVGLRER